MSTRSILARPVGDGWEGRYHHSDGYPTHMGPQLRKIREHFDGDVDRMLTYIIDEHPAGWSFLGGDLTQEPGYLESENMPKYPEGATLPHKDTGEPIDVSGMINHTIMRPRCFCHGDRHDEPWLFKSGNADNGGAQWVWVISERGVLVCFGDGNPVRFVRWDEEIDWYEIECGPNFEWCSHYCYVHFPNAPVETHRLGTAAYLGREPFSVNDAVGCWKNGVYYKLTGSGYLERRQVTGHPDGVGLLGVKTVYGNRWFATVEAPDGTRGELAVWHNYKTVPAKPCKGITLVFPSIREAVSE